MSERPGPGPKRAPERPIFVTPEQEEGVFNISTIPEGMPAGDTESVNPEDAPTSTDTSTAETSTEAPADSGPTRKDRRRERARGPASDTPPADPATPPRPKPTPPPKRPTPVPPTPPSSPDTGSPDTKGPDTRRTREKKEKIDVAAEEEWATKYFNEHVSLFDKKGVVKDGKFELVDVDVSDATKDLIDARSKLAEASTKARKGGVLGNRRAAEELDDYDAYYQEVRKLFIEEQLEGLGDDVTPAQKRALLAQLDAKEDGALMGEEANQYLAQEENKSLLRAAQEKFNKLSPKKKIALTVGAAALGVAVAGFTGGGAVVGAALAVGKFGKGLFTGASKRRGKARSDREKQEASTLRVSNYKQHEENMTTMGKLNKDASDETLLKRRNKRAERMSDKANTAIEAGRKEESKEKRKVMGKAALIAALPGAGYLLDDLLDFGGLKTDVEDLGNNLEDQVNDLQDQLSDTQAELAETQDQLADATDGGADVDADGADASDGGETGPEAPDVSEISAESQHLYGEFAGQDMDLTIPEGGNVWDQLEAQIDKEHPMMLNSEKQRLVGNMVEAMESHFGRDLDLVQPGEHFKFTLPS